MPFNIVIVHPQIPNNTGNIGRLCVATNSVLHLVEPFGFELTDKRLRRAGLDYWQKLQFHTYKNLKSFFQAKADNNLVFFSSNAETHYWDYSFKENDCLVFGCEEQGLPADIIETKKNSCFAIPQYSNNVRCLNLSNSVSIVLYEALRQTKNQS